MRVTGFGFGAVLALAASACSSSNDEATTNDGGPEAQVHPHLMLSPGDRELLLERRTREPYATFYQRLEDSAALEWGELQPGWVAPDWSYNATIAQANAMIAWLEEDQAAAEKAKDFLLRFETNFEDNRELDVNIRMPRLLFAYTNTWDLLQATPWLSEEEAEEGARRITEVTKKFADRYLDEPLYRNTALIITQNNHPLRTAAALGFVALAFPDHPDAERWLSWSVGEMDYLLGPKGHYIQPDGGVTEGPFYFGFGFSPTAPFLIALDRKLDPNTTFERTCISRNDLDPWTDHGCVEGEEYVFENPIHGELLPMAAEWSVALRRPNGLRAQLDDSNEAILNGGALLTGHGWPAYLNWDWAENPSQPLTTNRWFDTTVWHLVYYDDSLDAGPPTFTDRFFPDSGEAVFRSGWGSDDLWLMLVADHGAARKTLHNHADGTSFSMAAYGEDLLIDTGYYKPDSRDNAKTAHPPSHNMILVDGSGGPDKGLLNSWGDTDAFLENWVDTPNLSWAEGRKSYEQAEVRRGIAFVRQRYFVVADRVTSEVATPRSFAWRAHLWAGYDAGGSYAIAGNQLSIDRDLAGLDLRVATTEGTPSFVEPPYEPLTAPHVHASGSDGDHAVADATIDAIAPDFLTVLAPYPQGGTKLTVTSVDAGAGAAAWLVEGDGFSDVLWLRESGAPGQLAVPNGPTLASDAAVVITAADGSLALVAGGSTLSVDGSLVVDGNTDPVVVIE